MAAPTWEALGLDPQLLHALNRRGLDKPTPVQAAAVPRMLEGRDVVATARTGSGKTLAYLLPVLHRILAASSNDGPRAAWQGLVLVPTRELSDQVKEEAQSVTKHLRGCLAVTSLAPASGAGSARGNDAQLRALCASAGPLVVATPARVALALSQGILSKEAIRKSLCALVLDEADLLLSYGYQDDLQSLVPLVPKSCQTVLMSATTSAEVEQLQRLVLRNPVSLDLTAAAVQETPNGDGGNDHAQTGAEAAPLGVSETIEHCVLRCPREDKLLYCMAVTRLGAVRRKVLIFVNTVPQGYKVKLFLEAFGVRAALLNAELPLSSRHSVLQQFNKGLFDFLIATDTRPDDTGVSQTGGDPGGSGALERVPKRGKDKDKGKGGRRNGDKGKGKGMDDQEEYGVTRGVDFKDVKTVINFDAPQSVASYVHRVGRTGRAGGEGLAVTLACPEDEGIIQDIHEALGGASRQPSLPSGDAERDMDDEKGGDDMGVSDRGDGGAERAEGQRLRRGGLRPFRKLKKDIVEGLRYRAEDVARGLTKNVLREARVRDVRIELLNSERLQSHFDANPRDREVLRHDKPLAKGPGAAKATRGIPSYIRQKPMTQGCDAGSGGGGKAGGRVGGKRKRSGDDPLKAGFLKVAPRDEGMTLMEARAAKVARKEEKKRRKAGRR